METPTTPALSLSKRVQIEENSHCTYVLTSTEADPRNLFAMVYPDDSFTPGVNIWLQSFTMPHTDLATYQSEIRDLVQSLKQRDRELAKAEDYPFSLTELENVPYGTLLRKGKSLYSVEPLGNRNPLVLKLGEHIFEQKYIRKVW